MLTSDIEHIVTSIDDFFKLPHISLFFTDKVHYSMQLSKVREALAMALQLEYERNIYDKSR
jgi:hypothetical protein